MKGVPMNVRQKRLTLKRKTARSRKPRSKPTRYMRVLRLLAVSEARGRELTRANEELVHTAFQAVVDRDAERKRVAELEAALDKCLRKNRRRK